MAEHKTYLTGRTYIFKIHIKENQINIFDNPQKENIFDCMIKAGKAFVSD